MTGAVELVQVIRGERVESVHRGHAVICDAKGITEAWGNPKAVIYPRSACKMIQALPLVESGLAAGLSDDRLALACASHQGAAIHRQKVQDWLADIGLSEISLRCGSQEPRDLEERNRLVRAGETPSQIHNNCSGKHTGFLMLAKHLGGDPDYHHIDHPAQAAVKSTFEEVTGLDSPGWAIDGCSAPNFATTLEGLAGAMARFATARADVGARAQAMARLVHAMSGAPDLVAGEGRACTGLMRAMGGNAAVKTGAEGVFVAILPDRGLGVAVKIEDGATRAAEAVIAAILIRLGALSAEAPIARQLTQGPIRNWKGVETGGYAVTLG